MKPWVCVAAFITLVLAVAWPELTVAATAGPAPAGALNFWHHPTPATYFFLLGSGTAPGTRLPLFWLLVAVWGLALLLGLRRRSRTRTRYDGEPGDTPPEGSPGWRDGGRWEYPDSTPAPPPRRELR